MKKLKYILCTVIVVLLTSCSTEIREDKNHPAFREAASTFKVIEVEGCEYILFYGSNRELRYDGITHRGNCKNH